MECDCYLRHVQDSLADGRTPYRKRFHGPVDGQIWSYGAEILQKPIFQIVFTSLAHKMLAGLLIGSVPAPGRWMDWRLAHRRLGRIREERRIGRSREKVQIQRSTSRNLRRTIHIPMCRRIVRTRWTRRTSSSKPSVASARRSGCGRRLRSSTSQQATSSCRAPCHGEEGRFWCASGFSLTVITLHFAASYTVNRRSRYF